MTPGTVVPRTSPEWKLVLCRELVWHKEAVTALFLTPELRQLFSGDIVGHIACWAIPDAEAESIVLHDTQVTVCEGICKKRFGEGERRFECVTCKSVVCGPCGGTKMVVDRSGHYAQRWVCTACQHQSDSAAAAAAASAAAVAPDSSPSPPVRPSSMLGLARGASIASPQGVSGGMGAGAHTGTLSHHSGSSGDGMGGGSAAAGAGGGSASASSGGAGQRPFVPMGPRVSKQQGGMPQGGPMGKRTGGSMQRSTTSS